MSTPPPHKPLLGHLAELGWFMRQGEVAATHALNFLLRNDVLAQALLDEMERRAGVDLAAVSHFVTERSDAEAGRPDLEGIDDQGRPLLLVEAKFGAPLTSGQLAGYLGHQERLLGEGCPAVLMALVPRSRAPEAERVLGQVVAARNAAGQTRTAISGIVVTWDDWLDLWDAALHPELPESRALSGDLLQLRALCEAQQALAIGPLGDAAWREREGDLRRICDAVTRRIRDLHEPGFRVAPQQDELYGTVHFLSRRYFGSGLDATQESAASIGIAVPFADQGGPPLWVRFHRVTPGFDTIKTRLKRSRFGVETRDDQGHVWVPLRFSADAAGPEILTELLAQVEEIRAIVAEQVPEYEFIP